MNILVLTGIAVFFGTFGGKIFQKIKVPQVVGYIIIGVIMGESGLRLFSGSLIDEFTPVINIVLGIIGFMIGSELKGEVFKKYGRTIYAVLFGEGIGAFIFVSILVTVVTKKVYLGILFGALASATAPAATTDVLWEYKTKGPLTSTLLAVIALDDALSLILYGFASVFAKAMLTGHAGFSITQSVGAPVLELSESCLLGVAAGGVLFLLFKRIKDKERLFCFCIAAIVFIVGAALFLKLDFILSAMSLGVVLGNIMPQETKKICGAINSFSPPLYVLFFVLVGARLQARLFLESGIASLAIVYLIGRTSGKVLGAFSGGLVSRAQKAVTRYMGLCLFSQAGVAIGLAMVIYHNFSLLGPAGREAGLLVLNVITATTFVVQIIGPPSVKLAVTKAGEVWRDVTRDDIIDSYKAGDVMRRDFCSVREDAPLNEIIKTIKETKSYHLPVVSDKNELAGLISLGGIRNAFLEEQLNNILLAGDLADPPGIVLYEDQPLREAFEIFDKREVDYLPVLKNRDSKEVAGILEYKPLIDTVNRKLLERQALPGGAAK